MIIFIHSKREFDFLFVVVNSKVTEIYEKRINAVTFKGKKGTNIKTFNKKELVFRLILIC